MWTRARGRAEAVRLGSVAREGVPARCGEERCAARGARAREGARAARSWKKLQTVCGVAE